MAKIYTVEGVKHFEYTDKKTGLQTSADVVHVSCESDDPGMTGKECYNHFIRGGCSYGTPALGDKVHVIFKPGSKFADDVIPAI